MYKNKKIFILGMARSGYECAKLLSSDNEILLIDEEYDNEKINELESLGIKVLIVPRDKQAGYLDDTFDFVIKNPGISLTAPTIMKAHEFNIPVTTEIEVAYHFIPDETKVIGITGSNGKTTTTTIIYEILKLAGLNVVLGGNIGIPLSRLVKNLKKDSVLVMEISAQQLVNFNDFKTDISVITNLNDSHIDFFGKHDKYLAAKKRIINHHSDSDLTIYNANDLETVGLIKEDKSRKINFSAIGLDSNLYIKNETIYYNQEEIIKLSDIKLVGNHNYENIMASIGVVKEFNISNEIIKQFLNSFGGVEHRIQFIKSVNKRDFYNDSKATNVVATMTALQSFKTPVILLLGGMDRGHSFDDLKPYMNNVKLIVSYGETKDRIKKWADNINISCEVVSVLEDAVKIAYEKSNEGDTILLSPACASWDQYDKFETRGEDFIRIVNKL